MTIEFWVGSNFSTSHERKAIKDFLDSAYQLFSPRQEPFYVLSNFYLGGRQIDLVLIKPDSILVADLKDCAEPFRASENGPWQIIDTKVSIGTGVKNPYQQIKELRNIWIDELSEREEITHKVSKLNLRKFVHGAIVVSPELNPKTENKIPRSAVWFHLFGLSSLPNEFLSLSCPSVELDPKDIQLFIREHLRLSPGEFSTGLVFEPLSRAANVSLIPEKGAGLITGHKPLPRPSARLISPEQEETAKPIRAVSSFTSTQDKQTKTSSVVPEKKSELPVAAANPPSRRKIGVLGWIGVILGSLCLLWFCAGCALTAINSMFSSIVAASTVQQQAGQNVTNQSQPTPTNPEQAQINMLQNSKIAYLFDGNIYIMTPYGTSQTQLTFFTGEEKITNPISWSPDGTKLVFDKKNTDSFDLFVVDTNTKEISLLYKSGYYNSAPSWSSDGKYIYYSSSHNQNWDIFRYSIESETEEQITDFPSDEYTPKISPDGKKLLFQSNMTGEWNIHLLNLGDESVLRLSRNEYVNYDPQWRPNTPFITYMIKIPNSWFPYYRYAYVNIDTLEQEMIDTDRLMDTSQRHSWSPDGNLMVYAGKFMCIYNDNFRQLDGLTCGNEGATMPVWSPVL